jgi:homopolymeric O-antigen transport system ATP-binding protein
MPEASIIVDSVWKKFRRGEHHDTLRDVLLALPRKIMNRPARREAADEFWALRDVSFSVRPGETLGIIGGNGAGKSTMLKLLTRIMRPNRGAIRVEGRIGALIEVSAGFHPDLTGRENIFLQGSLMGMRRVQIAQKFDQIVEFSGIEEFLDTPVKRYSSGMNARLGFAIAAHLDPDVLIIDEVLSVGDFRFQQRAFARLAELAKSGRPVVVVSHQLERIAQLCSKALLLVHGEVHVTGTPEECISAYLGQSATQAALGVPIRFGTPVAEPRTSVPVGGEFAFTIRVECPQGLPAHYSLGVRVRRISDGQVIFATTTSRQKVAVPEASELSLHAGFQAHLIPAQYAVQAYVYDTLNYTELAASGPVYLQVLGDEVFAAGSAHLGGRMAVVRADARVAVEERR